MKVGTVMVFTVVAARPVLTPGPCRGLGLSTRCSIARGAAFQPAECVQLPVISLPPWAHEYKAAWLTVAGVSLVGNSPIREVVAVTASQVNLDKQRHIIATTI